MTGTNGSQLRDTTFISLAIVETGLIAEVPNHESYIKTLGWLEDVQTERNRCTSEGLSAYLSRPPRSDGQNDS